MEVILDDIPVMYVGVPYRMDAASEGLIPEAFAKVESALDWNLKGRGFYGALIGAAKGTVFEGEYRACVATKDADEPARFGFQAWTIPGGKYARTKIKDWEKHIADIGPAFQHLLEANDVDPTRPRIEFYRSQAELLLLVPIK